MQFVSSKLHELCVSTTSEIVEIKQSEAKNMLVSVKSGDNISKDRQQRPKVDLSFLLKLKRTSSEVSIAQLRRIMHVIAPLVQVPPISAYYEERKTLLENIFGVDKLEMEGPGSLKQGRNIVTSSVAYCKSPVELFKRWQGDDKFEKIKVSGPLIQIKLGCDGGQGFLKWSAQLLELSANSVSNLMLHCVADIPEAKANLKQLAELPCIKEIFDSHVFQTTIVSDLKVTNLLASVTHGCYPCIYCNWRKSNGTDITHAESMTVELQTSLAVVLEENYGGDRNKSKLVRGCNGIPVFPSIDALHFFCPPELHLLLGIVKRLYDKIIEEMTLESQSKHKELLSQHGIYLDPRHGGEFQRNSARKVLDKLGELRFKKGLTLDCLIAFQGVVNSCFGTFRKIGFDEDVNNFKFSWAKVGIPVTTKAHIIFCHVVPFLELLGMLHDVPYGLGWVSEQALEASHQRFNHRWGAYNLKSNHPNYREKLRQ